LRRACCQCALLIPVRASAAAGCQAAASCIRDFFLANQLLVCRSMLSLAPIHHESILHTTFNLFLLHRIR
jgi:hypothetical protein